MDWTKAFETELATGERELPAIQCDECESEATHIGEPDPYAEEINRDDTPVNLCDSCYHEALMDI